MKIYILNKLRSQLYKNDEKFVSFNFQKSEFFRLKFENIKKVKERQNVPVKNVK